MTYLFYASAVALTLMACRNEREQARSDISALETRVAESGDPGAAAELIQRYQTYVSNHPEDADAGPRYLYRAAALHYRMNQPEPAKAMLERALRDYPADENASKAALLLGSIYEEKIRDELQASIVYQSAAQRFPELANNPNVANTISSGLAPVAQRLEAISRALYPDTTGRVDLRRANDFIAGVTAYALIHPQGEQVPNLLYQAAETARTAQAFTKAIELYDLLIDKQPDFPKVPQAMFLKAFTLDNDLRRLDEAREMYERFLARYPQDEFADDAQFLLENLGRSDEEIIESFDQRQAEQ